MSCFVLNLENENLIVGRSIEASIPFKTCDPVLAPDVHADPPEQATP